MSQQWGPTGCGNKVRSVHQIFASVQRSGSFTCRGVLFVQSRSSVTSVECSHQASHCQLQLMVNICNQDRRLTSVDYAFRLLTPHSGFPDSSFTFLTCGSLHSAWRLAVAQLLVLVLVHPGSPKTKTRNYLLLSQHSSQGTHK